MQLIHSFLLLTLILQTFSYTFRDDFDGASLDPGYTVLNVATTNGLKQANGQLYTDIIQNAVWWQDQKNALFIYKILSGDFKLTTTLFARTTSNPNNQIRSGYHYAGPMIRLPSSETGPNNFVFIGSGYSDGQIYIETKSNVNNVPQIRKIPVTGNDAWLRICKFGSVVRVYHQIVGSDQMVLEDQYTRNDFVGDFQVGLMAFSFQGNDFRPIFEYFDFQNVTSLNECTTDASTTGSTTSHTTGQSSTTSQTTGQSTTTSQTTNPTTGPPTDKTSTNTGQSSTGPSNSGTTSGQTTSTNGQTTSTNGQTTSTTSTNGQSSTSSSSPSTEKSFAHKLISSLFFFFAIIFN